MLIKKELNHGMILISQNSQFMNPAWIKLLKGVEIKNLYFSTDIKENIASADLIFISVNTPTKTKGVGAGEASDLKWVESCARQVANFAKGHTIVVEKSTLPVRTAEVIKKYFRSISTYY